MTRGFYMSAYLFQEHGRVRIYADIGPPYLIYLGIVDIDVNYPCLRAEFLDLSGSPVIKSDAYGYDRSASLKRRFVSLVPCIPTSPK
jgi:hypothetical protein